MTITTFKPTLMQRLLGRNYKWWYFILFHFKSQRAYLVDTIMWTGYSIINIVGSLFIWWLTTKDNINFDTNIILTYLFAGNIILSFINSWAEMDMGWMNKGGSITSILLRPTPFLKSMYVKYLGRNILGNFPISIIGYVLLFPAISNYIVKPESTSNFILALLFLPISYTINFFLNLAFGCITFWITETDGAVSFYGYFKNFLIGALIPLFVLTEFLPWIKFQPLAWVIHHPMQIYLGKYSPIEILYVFLGGIAWCSVLYFLAKVVFKAGLKRNESVGL